jgi:streptogramin lyase
VPTATSGSSTTATTRSGASTAGVVSNFTDTGISAERHRSGPDGNLWFTNAGTGNSIGRITPAGVVSNFTDASLAHPTAIAAGPDGRLWFTNGTKSAGNIATDGTIVTFVAGAVSLADSIVAGPDVAMWLTNYGNSTVGRITMAGVVSHYLDVNTMSRPSGISVGPDGALWFTDQSTVGRGGGGFFHRRITSTTSKFVGDGVSQPAAPSRPERPLVHQPAEPVARSGDDRVRSALPTGLPFALAAGADGNLWFTSGEQVFPATNVIVRMTPSGVARSPIRHQRSRRHHGRRTASDSQQRVELDRADHAGGRCLVLRRHGHRTRSPSRPDRMATSGSKAWLTPASIGGSLRPGS